MARRGRNDVRDREGAMARDEVMRETVGNKLKEAAGDQGMGGSNDKADTKGKQVSSQANEDTDDTAVSRVQYRDGKSVA